MEPNQNQQPLQVPENTPQTAQNPPNASVNPQLSAQPQGNLHNHWNTRRDYANSWVQPRQPQQIKTAQASTPSQPNDSVDDSDEDEDEDFDMPDLDHSPLITMPTQPAIEPKFSLKKLNRFLPRGNKDAQQPIAPYHPQPYQISEVAKQSDSSNNDYLPLISLALAFGAPLGGLIVAFTALKDAKQKDEPTKLIIFSLIINSIVFALFIFFAYLVLSRRI